MEAPVVLTLPVCLTSGSRHPTRKIQFPILFGSTYRLVRRAREILRYNGIPSVSKFLCLVLVDWLAR